MTATIFKVQTIPLALAVILPWLVGLILHAPMMGCIASFATYLMVVSFPAIPGSKPLSRLLISAVIFTFFAALGLSTTFGTVYFYFFALLAALAQGLAELRGGHLRLPVALAALAFFLTNGMATPEVLNHYIVSFGAGCLWAVPFILFLIKRETAPPTIIPLRPFREPSQYKFLICIMLTALCGCMAVSFSTLIHACWLPAAALRVIKPTWADTKYRIRARGMGTLMGAVAGSIILSLSAFPLFHIIVVGILVLTMLQIGAKNYFKWTFCLTAIALAFNEGFGVNVYSLALERTLLTIIGISITAIIMMLFSYHRAQQNG
ncbi:FUSC family protein [Escherichia coli]|nr:FUSC family protein [Escherichia coli]EFN7962867.1 FUSC family protein [Escherichia coli]